VPKSLLVALSAFVCFSVSAPAHERLHPVREYQAKLPAILTAMPDVRGTNPRLDVRKTPVKAYVLVFMGTQCRLVRDYLERLGGWAEEWSKQGVVVAGVFSHKHETQKEIAEFAESKKVPFLMLHDSKGELAQLIRARQTPEAFVLGDDLQVLYRGRIDDQFQFRATLPKASNHYLKDAVTSVLAGKFPAPAVTDLEGCFLNLQAPHRDVTFNQDVGPMMYQRCTPCHRENEVGGELFKFTSFDNISPHAETILGVVEDRVMPPWRAGLAGNFRNDFSLDANEIWMLRSWAKNGAKLGEGEPLKAPPAPSPEGFRAGKPDAILHMTPDDAPDEKKFFRIPPKSETPVLAYKYFRVKTNFPEDKWMVSAEIKALAPTVVHHVTVFMVPDELEDQWILEGGFSKNIAKSLAKRRYNIAPENFEWTFRLYGRGMRRRLRLIATFSPTEPTRRLPEGYGYLIPKGAELIFEAHYTPTEEAKFDRAAVGMWFAPMPQDPSTKQVITRSAAFMDSIQIPPGETFDLNRKIKFFADAKLFTIRPHMHQRGKSFTGVLERPDGSMETLVHVPNWDYGWQVEYQLDPPVIVPKGSILHSNYHWDNTDRPGNPDHTQHVKFGQQISDEMCLSYPTYVYLNPAEQDEAEQQLEQYIIDGGK